MWKNFSGICGEKKPTIVEEFFRKFRKDYIIGISLGKASSGRGRW
jgi:hypothetical protein